MCSLRQYHSPQLVQLVHRIVQCTPPEKLYLHGIRFDHQYGLSVFNGHTGHRQRVLQYHFLALLPMGGEGLLNTLQDKIETACRPIAAVTAVALSMKQFNEWLHDGYSFAHHIYHNALLCHDAGAIGFAAPGKYHHPAARVLKPWRKRANEFLAGAQQYINRREYPLAAFMLHQAAEQSLIALIMTATGYRAPWHKMDRLWGMALSVTESISNVFPRDTEKEEMLFRLLQNAYTQPRYRDDYTISEVEIKTLYCRVEQLLQLTKEGKEKEWQLMLVTPESVPVDFNGELPAGV
jgi:HEPN domain-containing protein